jgi:hypothetical protein
LQSILLIAAHVVAIVYVHVRFKSTLASELRDGAREARQMLTDQDFWYWWLGLSVAIAMAQAVILFPVRRPAPRWNGQGRSMWMTLMLCSLLIGGVWAGVAFAVFDAAWLLNLHDWAEGTREPTPWLLICPILGWLVATPLVVRFVRRGRREDRLSRLASRLFLGTVIEVIAIVPLDVMVRRKSDCYCERGTFWAFLLCGTAGFAALGPAVLLPLLAGRRKRWYAGHCEVCGYDMAGLTQAPRCPECGAGWRSELPGA